MTLQVVFLASAESDLQDLKSYILHRFDRDTWRTSYGKIKDAVARIRHHPEAGKVLPELERLDMVQYRQVLAGKNRIVYEVRADTAYIHLVCDTRRDLQALLMRRLVRSS